MPKEKLTCKKLKELIDDERQARKEYKMFSETTDYPDLFSKLSADEHRHQLVLTLLHGQIC